VLGCNSNDGGVLYAYVDQITMGATMLNHFRRLLALAFCCFGFPGIIQAEEKKLDVNGVTRQAIIIVPEKAKTEKTPVLFVFHGHTGTMGHANRTMNFQKHWPEALVVYMQGLPTPGALNDPEGKFSGWQKTAGDQEDRDLKFFDAMLKDLKANYNVDDSRIYSTGHSNGGSFTYILWANRGDILAGVAPSAAVAPKEMKKLTPKPAILLTGMKDPLVKTSWQELNNKALRKLFGDAPEKEWETVKPFTGKLYEAKNAPLVILTHAGGHEFPTEAPGQFVKFLKAQVKTKSE
jgi:polyhydroxybutyrate depolymerase